MTKLPDGATVVTNGAVLPDGASVVQEPEPGITRRDILRETVHGATFALSDEITAALAAIPAAVATGTSLKDAFGSILEAERSEQQRFAEEHPVASTALQVAGGLTTGGAGAARIAGAKAFQGGATAAARTGRKLAGQAAVAAPVGAAFGFGASEGGLDPEGIKERATGALKGAGIAMVAAPVLAAGAGTLTRATKGVAGLFKGKEVRDFNQSTRQLARAIIRDDDTPEELIKRAKNLGPEANLADVGGANIKRELERAASIPGQAPEITEKALISRLARSGARVQQVFDRFIGRNTKDAVKTLEGLSEDAADKAAPLYAKAYDAVVNNKDSRLATLLANPRVQKAIPKAIERIKSKSSDDDDVLRVLQAELDPDNPNMILWDHVKRQLDDDASVAYRSGASSLGDDIAKNSRTLREALDIQSPDYKEARGIWAGSQSAKEAFEDGLNYLKGVKNPLTGASAKVAKFNELSESEKDLFKKGVSMAVRQIVRSADDVAEGVPPASLLKQIYGSKEKRFIINKVIPTNEGRADLSKALRAEQEFRRTTNDVLRNSRTALRTELTKEPSAVLSEKAGMMVNAWFALRGNYFAAARGISNIVKGSPPTEGVNTQIAKRLTAKGEEAIDAALKDVDKFLTLPEATTNAIGRYRQVPKGEKLNFLRANPQIKKEIDRTVAALTAGIYASGKVKDQTFSRDADGVLQIPIDNGNP